MPSPKTLQSIQAQIRKLQEEESEYIQRERDSVLERVREAISTYKLTQAEVFGPSALTVRKTIQAAGKKPKMSYKFGQVYEVGDRVWAGRGHIPSWLIEAMEETGKPIEAFAKAETQTQAG